MASQPIPLDPKYILDLVIKRRWFIVVPFCLIIMVGIYMAITLPAMYEGETLIIVEPQRVPTDYVRSIVSTEISSRISTISQQIMSRTNLEKVINDFKLFSDEKTKNMFHEDKLENLRKRVVVKVVNQPSGVSAFTVSFKDASPQKVVGVANALASYFINENLKVRETQAIGTSNFLEIELNRMLQRLEEREGVLRQYKKTYMGELPEQLQSNLKILESLQNRKNETQKVIREFEGQIYTLKNTYNTIDPFAGGMSMDFWLDDNQDMGGGQNSYELTQAKIKMEQLKQRYTDNHPDVLQLSRTIKDLESKIEAESAQNAANEVLPAEPLVPAIDFQATQMAELKSAMKQLQEEIEKLDTQIATYEKRIEDTPRREQELVAIQRDYDNINSLYASLLNRKLESEIAVNMERRQQGEQFRILDPARLPEKPISPNMKILFLFFVGASIAVGGGLIFILEYMDNSFKRPDDIEAELSLPVLCTIPQIVGRKTVILRRLEHVACALFGLVSVLLLAGFAALTQKGVEPTLELVRKIVNL